MLDRVDRYAASLSIQNASDIALIGRKMEKEKRNEKKEE